MVDIWLRLVVRIGGNKITKAIMLPKKLSDPGTILELFTEIEELCKNMKPGK